MSRKGILSILLFVIGISFSGGIKAQNVQDTIPVPDSALNLSQAGTSLQLNQTQIRILPFRNLSAFGLVSPSAYNLKNGRMFYHGIESGENHTFIDGMQIGDASNFPVRLIQSYSLYSSQAPMEMGFTSGGITAIKTLSQIRDFTVLADVNADLAYNMQSFNGELFIAVPLASSKRKESGRAIPTLLLAGKYSWTNNNDPVWKRTQKLSSETLADLSAYPLRHSGMGSGTYLNAEFVMPEDFVDQTVPDNNSRSGIYPFIKLSLPVARNINLSIGNYSAIDKTDAYDFDNALFNSKNNAVRTRQNYDTYLNWKHKIEVNADLSLTYDLHFQYSNYYQKTEDKRHGKNFFDYGYLGKFTSYKMPAYELGSDSVDGVFYNNVWLLNSWDLDTLTTWEASDINPDLAAYTDSYFDLFAGDPEGHYRNRDEIILGGGLYNGQTPSNVYGLWNNTGSNTPNYQEKSLEKIRAAFYLKVDYKSQHFLVGGEYNRETHRQYDILAHGLWNIMRYMTNYHLTQLDRDNPIAIEHNGTVDTIIYYRDYDAISQRNFDKNLRKSLGLPVDGLDYIMTDSYDPVNNTISYYDKYGEMHTISTPENFLKLDMFSEMELLNNGRPYVNYVGYDYTGNKQSGKLNPYSFYEDYTIDASRPEYWAVYLQDEFKWKKLNVRLGFRFDVYDANRPIVNDMYSLYPIYNVEEATMKGEFEFEKPDNIGDDYLLYVDREFDPTRAVGYRKNDQWYNADGVEVDNPFALDVGNGISPYLKYPYMQRIGGEDWTPDMTFHDYKKTVSILPQISLDYSILDKLNLYINYSSFSQNPNYLSDFRPDIYYFWHGYVENQIIPNPGLQAMQTGKLFAGLKWIVWRNLVADVSFLRTSINNYIHPELILGAFPITYVTVVNAKNKITTNGFQGRIDFVNPTASGAMGGFSFVKLFPGEKDLNYFQVSDLVLNTYLGYRFGNSNNPNNPSWVSMKALRGFAASIYYQFRHGTPYIAKNVNNARVIKLTPNVNLFNLNIQKDFVIGKKAAMNIYLTIENLFNFKNVFDVYSKTGNAEDDGYLSAPEWQAEINNQLDPDSYRLLYQMHLYQPSYYDIPRIWRVGLIFKY